MDNKMTGIMVRGFIKPAVLVSVVVLCLTVAIVWLSSGSSVQGKSEDAGNTAVVNRQDSEWFDVEKRSFNLTVVATGELEAKNQIEVKSLVKSNVAIVQIVDEGTAVKRGDLLFTLESKAIEEKIDQETLSVETARADKITVDRNLEIEKNNAISSQKTAEVKVDKARLDFKKWQDGDDPKQRRSLKLAKETAERKLKLAKRNYESSIELYEEKFISENEKDDDWIKMIEATAALETAVQDIDIYEKYTYPKDLMDKESAESQAVADLKSTIAKNENTLARMKADQTSKVRRLKIRETTLREQQEQLSRTKVVAPQDGLVVYASSVGPSWRRQDPIKQGKQIRFNETLIVLPDTSQMIATILVHEAMVPQVKAGQTVNVTIDAMPGEILVGTVQTIAVMAEDGGWMNRNLREYKVKVALPEEQADGLKPSMRCSGEIVVGRVEDAIAVPIQAVYSEGKEHFVYVKRGGVTKQNVKIGRSSETFVEIKEGLEPGVQVLLRDPQAGE
ncbi:efflux RND transporter periplasmic adaptor subunit [Poriferisphaera sp. WC338]|uniref:efflux RND transporter periplasmic adaptor subunit n=1 Tax=Poriferisphaera sp. WC338 TaxID=3425129 RepID=UPI003D819DE2